MIVEYAESAPRLELGQLRDVLDGLVDVPDLVGVDH